MAITKPNHPMKLTKHTLRKSAFLLAAAGSAMMLSNANATVVNLDNGDGTINGAVFTTNFIQPAGTGVFDPFLTVQNSPWEQGYNHSAGDLDTKRNGVWTTEIKFSDMQVTTIGGQQYYGFAIDVNEPNGGGKAPISLNDLSLWTSATVQSSTSTDNNGFFNGTLGTERYSLGNNSVLYTDRNNGSGQADISIFVPVSDFAGANKNDFVYLFQRWGNTQDSQGGYEETRVIAGVAPVPEMNALLPILGLVAAVGSTHVLRRRKARQSA
jgi:hypothetical protein